MHGHWGANLTLIYFRFYSLYYLHAYHGQINGTELYILGESQSSLGIIFEHKKNEIKYGFTFIRLFTQLLQKF